MRELARVRWRDVGDVLDRDGRAREVVREAGVVVLELGAARGVGGEDARALHLVEDGVVRRVDFVAPVDVRGEEPLALAARERLDLVRGGVRAEHEVLVDVVAVRRGASWMVRGES